MSDYESPWHFGGKPINEAPEGYIGFVYMITEKKTGRKYVGKKLFHGMRKKGKRRVKVESDWKKYFGSSAALQEEVEKQGPDAFHREILHLCKRKGEMSYMELKEQMDRNVLFSENYFNEFVGCKIHSRHVKNLKEEFNADS